MTEKNDKERAPDSAYFGRLGRAWPARGEAPGGTVGASTGGGVLACVLGVVALVLVALDVLPLLTFTVAGLGVVCGLGIFLPRVTLLGKVLFAVGVVASLITIVILLTRLTQ